MKQPESNFIDFEDKINNVGKLIFPSGFLWGSSTSSHQVEGGNFNDWTEWEHANSARLAAEAARRHAKTHMRIPDYILERYPNPLQPENYISGKACDHYNLYEQDFDIAKELGQNAHRFSIEWSRIEPEEGKFNEAQIEHYREVIQALRARGLEPFVTLWHWTNPVWIRDIGGWENKKTIEYFLKYVERIAQEFGQLVKFWITLNEPDDVYAFKSYFSGEYPPQKRSLLKAKRVFNNLAKAHIGAYKIIHKFDPSAVVGFANNTIFFEPNKNHLINKVFKFFADRFWNFWFFRMTSPYHDFIGCSYYFRNKIRNLRFNKNDNYELSDAGWDICPDGIYYVLKELKKYKKPIYITENGIADARDEKRAKFIKDHLSWVNKAIQDGVDVRGYFYWSLLDNFEWEKGFWPRFGLVEVDYRAERDINHAQRGYKTLERKIRPSAYEYAKICKNNSIESS